MKNNRTGHLKLLMARSYKRSKVVCGEIRCLSVKQKLYRIADKKTYVQFNPRKTLNPYIGRFYHQIATSSEIQLNFGSS